jgi:hypothetical protein
MMAESVTVFAASTGRAETGKVMESLPEGTTTAKGTLAVVRSLLVIATGWPSAGALPLMVTVAAEEVPPVIDAALVERFATSRDVSFVYASIQALTCGSESLV